MLLLDTVQSTFEFAGTVAVVSATAAAATSKSSHADPAASGKPFGKIVGPGPDVDVILGRVGTTTW